MTLNKRTFLECGGLTPLCYRRRLIDAKAASSRRTPKRRSFVVAILVVGVCLATNVGGSNVIPQLQPGSLCEQSEKIVFSCTVAKPSKIVSLCSSKEFTKDKGYLQYRFGLPGKIELEYPKQRERTQAAFKYSHYFRAQFDMTDISFSSEGYDYSIFDDYNGEQNPVTHEQGIKINGPNKEWVRNCRGRAKAQYGDLADALGVEP